MHPLGERLGREHHRLGQRFRRVELLGYGQVLGRRAHRQRAGTQAARQPVRGLPRGTEPAGHVVGRQRGQIPQRVQAEPAQQGREILAGQIPGRVLAGQGTYRLPGQDAYRLPGQELRRPARRDDQDRADATSGVGAGGADGAGG